MPGTVWAVVAAGFHERVRSNCWDSLAGELLNLHRPHLFGQEPVCQGCDRDQRGSTDPVWPCRTYTIIAATLLVIGHDQVEGTLRHLLEAADRRVNTSRVNTR